MKQIAFVLLFTAASLMGKTQDSTATDSLREQAFYRTAAGFKLGNGAGLSVKHFGRSANAFELIAFFQRNSSRITGLYEIHGHVGGAPGLRWYAGPGAHISFANTRKTGKANHIGIDGVVGLDYHFSSAPINISLDLQPSYEFGNSEANGLLGGLGIRYTF
jgi:hypothetical protein